MAIPARAWLSTYEPSWLRADVVAGITLAAYLLPSAIGDASLAGLPSEAGLYACLFGGLAFWIFCSSRHTALSVTSPNRRRRVEQVAHQRGRHELIHQRDRDW